MIEVSRGDIIWLNQSKIDKKLVKALGESVQDLHRPFVVISNNKNNKYSPTVQLSPLTKQIHKSNYPMHVTLNKFDYDYFKHHSIILTEQVITINKKLIEHKVVSLNRVDMKKLNKAIFIQLISEDFDIDMVI